MSDITLSEQAEKLAAHELEREITPQIQAAILKSLMAGIAIEQIVSEADESRRYRAKIMRNDPNREDIDYQTLTLFEARASDPKTAKLRVLWVAHKSGNVDIPKTREQELEDKLASLMAKVESLEAKQATAPEPQANPVDEMTKEEVIAALEGAGVEVDKRLGTDKLREKLVESLNEQAAAEL